MIHTSQCFTYNTRHNTIRYFTRRTWPFHILFHNVFTNLIHFSHFTSSSQHLTSSVLEFSMDSPTITFLYSRITEHFSRLCLLWSVLLSPSHAQKTGPIFMKHHHLVICWKWDKQLFSSRPDAPHLHTNLPKNKHMTGLTKVYAKF